MALVQGGDRGGKATPRTCLEANREREVKERRLYVKRAASAVQRLGSVKGARVDVSALTREIECWVDFDDG